MKKFYLDAGTTWSKILEIDENNQKYYRILPSKNLAELKEIKFEKATGHNFSLVKKENYVNEVVALAFGANEFIKPNGIVLDLGSRDIKWVKYKDNKFVDMDWNSSCASATGATVEMLLKFYDIKAEDLKFCDEKYTITCGIFGLEKIMDDISKGESPQIAISKFIHGLAYNAYNFSKNPDELFISGGFCENKCFIESLSKYTKVTPLGRYLLLDGLLID